MKRVLVFVLLVFAVDLAAAGFSHSQIGGASGRGVTVGFRHWVTDERAVVLGGASEPSGV